MHIDTLEPRTHFSTATVVRQGNILTITGTGAADEIVVEAGKTTSIVYVNNRQWNVLNRFVKSVRIYGLVGNDSIIVSPNFNIRCSIEGGTGNDRIGGGALDDSIWGGRGDDIITGNQGYNYLDGGPGDDQFSDKVYSVDVCHGGSGNDIVTSSAEVYCTGIEKVNDISYQPEPVLPIVLSSIQRVRDQATLHIGQILGSLDKLLYDPIRETHARTFLIRGRVTKNEFTHYVLVDHQFDVTEKLKSTIIYRLDVTDLRGGPNIVIQFPFLIAH